MSSHEEAIDLLRKGSLLLCILSEEIGLDPDRITKDFSANGGNTGALNVGDVVRRMDALVERHEWMLDEEVPQ